MFGGIALVDYPISLDIVIVSGKTLLLAKRFAAAVSTRIPTRFVVRSARVLRTPTLTTTYNDFRNTPYMQAYMHIYVYMYHYCSLSRSPGRRRGGGGGVRSTRSTTARARKMEKKTSLSPIIPARARGRTITKWMGKKNPLSYRSDRKRRRSTDAYVTCKYYIIVCETVGFPSLAVAQISSLRVNGPVSHDDDGGNNTTAARGGGGAHKNNNNVRASEWWWLRLRGGSCKGPRRRRRRGNAWGTTTPAVSRRPLLGRCYGHQTVVYYGAPADADIHTHIVYISI